MNGTCVLGAARNSKELRDMDFSERAKKVLEARRVIDDATDCWLWTGAKVGTFPHGIVRINGKGYLVHRLAAFLWLGLDIKNRHKGSRKDDSQVNHECSNPSCFNPDHLYVGTQKENINDIPKAILRESRLKTHCKKGHEYTSETKTSRGCSICQRDYIVGYLAKTKEHRMQQQRERRARRKAAPGVAA